MDSYRERDKDEERGIVIWTAEKEGEDESEKSRTNGLKGKKERRAKVICGCYLS